MSQCAHTLHQFALWVPALSEAFYTKAQPEAATTYPTHVTTESQDREDSILLQNKANAFRTQDTSL